MQNTHTINQANQIKFDSFGLLLADFWLTVCGTRSQYYKVQLAYASHGCTKTQLGCERFVSGGAEIQLSYVPSLFQTLKYNIHTSTIGNREWVIGNGESSCSSPYFVVRILLSNLFTNHYSQSTKSLTNIILFNHSFGGLSPPKAAWVQV